MSDAVEVALIKTFVLELKKQVKYSKYCILLRLPQGENAPEVP